MEDRKLGIDEERALFAGFGYGSGSGRESAIQETVEWLVARRRRLKERRLSHQALKPGDHIALTILGAKMKALQEVVDYLMTLDGPQRAYRERSHVE